MKVLFVIRGKSGQADIAHFIHSQAESLDKEGIETSFFQVTGNGFIAYLSSSRKLRTHLKNNPCDLIHAHYSLCGYTAVLSFSGRPIVLSLMGSDALGEYIRPGKTTLKGKLVVLLTYLIQPFIKAIIVKSVHIQNKVYCKKSTAVIPNGVRMDLFRPETIAGSSRKKLGWKKDGKYVLFINNPKHPWKNFSLAQKAFEMAGNENASFMVPFPVPHNEVADYFNAADVLLMTSFMEGSSNVIKEAMACNCPIVATDVGDAKWVIGNTRGCFINSFEPEDVAAKIKLAMKFSREEGRTDGRQRIVELGLDSETIANRIIIVYEKAIA